MLATCRFVGTSLEQLVSVPWRYVGGRSIVSCDLLSGATCNPDTVRHASCGDCPYTVIVESVSGFSTECGRPLVSIAVLFNSVIVAWSSMIASPTISLSARG